MENVITLFDDYTTIASNPKYEVKQRKGHPADLATRLKILSPKQMLEGLPINSICTSKSG